MKLEDLMKIGDKQCKRHRTTSVASSGVVISVIKQGATYKSNRAKIAVITEPGDCNFAKTPYWRPIFVEKENKLYLIYSNKADGYKVADVKGGIGSIEFTNHELVHLLESKGVTSKNVLTRTWFMDKECGRPYITLN